MKKVVSLLLACLFLCVACLDNVADSAASRQKSTPKEEKPRYMRFYADDSFVYYMDRGGAKWVHCPNTLKEYMLDIWIRMDQRGYTPKDEKYSYPSKYYLEHYYIRPLKEQVMFLCELEVMGRPDNNVKQQEYSVDKWEDLVPGSMEEIMFRAVVEELGKTPNTKSDTFDLGDALEDVFRIAL